jgi:hypothetical protein
MRTVGDRPDLQYSVLVGVRLDTLSLITPSLNAVEGGMTVVTSYLDGMLVPAWEKDPDPSATGGPVAPEKQEDWDHRLNHWCNLHHPRFYGIKRTTEGHLAGQNSQQYGSKSTTAITFGDTSARNTSKKTIMQQEGISIDMKGYIDRHYGFNGILPSPDDAECVVAPLAVLGQNADSIFGGIDPFTTALDKTKVIKFQAKAFAKCMTTTYVGEYGGILVLATMGV